MMAVPLGVGTDRFLTGSIGGCLRLARTSAANRYLGMMSSTSTTVPDRETS